jgi:hypothetical protein
VSIKNIDPKKIRLHFILYWKILLSKAFLKSGRSLFYSLCKMYRSNWFTNTAQSGARNTWQEDRTLLLRIRSPDDGEKHTPET